MSKTGYKGAVKINGVTIGGLTVWSSTGSVRQFEDYFGFGDEHQKSEELGLIGGEVTVTGRFIEDSDEGQQLLRTLYKAGTHITDLELYFDLDGDGSHMELDPSTDTASYAVVNKTPDITHDAGALGTFSVSLKIVGELRPNSTTTSVAVETHGAWDVADVTAKLMGELISIGEETSVDCYFEYGKTTSYGSDTSVSATTKTAVGLFDNDVAGLDSSTEYHFRTVIELADESTVKGKDKTFTTLS